MKRSYRIFVLFLLMSISSFATSQWLYTQVNKSDLEKTYSYWDNWYYDINFYMMIDEVRSLATGNKNLEKVLESSSAFNPHSFKKRGSYEKYDYDGKKRPMLEFKLSKRNSAYGGNFRRIEYSNYVIDQNYTIPAPITNFQEEKNKPTNRFTYTETNQKWHYTSEEVVFRLYKGSKHDHIRPINRVESHNLGSIDRNNNYVDFVFENNGSQQEIIKGGVTAKFVGEKFEITGLNEGVSYKLDFYTLRYGANGNKEYVVATYEDSLEFVGKNPDKPIESSSSQWIYSQITRANLVNSDKYLIDFYENIDTIKTIDEDGNLEELLKSEGGYSGSDNFSQQEQERYNYLGDPKSIIEFKLKETSNKSKNGKFELTIEENNVLKRKINESYTIPTPITDFKEQDLESSKNTFTYEDKYELENLKAYKYQEAVFRLYKGSQHNGIRPIKRIEDNDFDNIDGSYIDFVFENNGSTQEIEKNGIKGRFIEGKFELMGLEDGIDYNLDFYTMRYRDNDSKGNYVAVTYEGSLDFIGKNRSSLDRGIWLEDIDISQYKTIKLDIITLTSEELRELDILNLNETRVGETREEKTGSIPATKIELNKVWIAEKEYEVIDNQITLDNGDIKYVHKWTGVYETKFEQEEGKIREINFYVSGNNVNKTSLTGKYIEPAKVEVDTGLSHQWVMFEFEPTKEFKNQNYKIEDRVLTPERLGYRQLKTIDYGSDLDDYLYGKSNHNLTNKFTYSNGVWSYPERNNSAGFIIEKTITESKGNLKGEDESELLFYTDKTGSGIEKLGETGNKVTYRWNEGPLNTNGEILNYDKVIFRITKKSSGEDYSWNPYISDNSINYIDETTEGNHRLEEFLFGNENYVDLVLDASTSKTLTLNNAIVSYEQTNKELRIVGLPVGDYNIQFYSVKRGHDGGYKVITYENQSEFKMDISDIAGPEFEKENNIHKIDFITTGTSGGAIQVNVNFITKMERSIDLTVKNLKSGDFKIEETNEGTGEKEGIGEAGKISLKESDMKKVLFPLDVIFVIDNSGSMQDEIDKVKDGLSAFGQELLDRGFDVKYNLITFGPEQTIGTINESWKTKVNEYLDYNYYRYYNRTNPFLAIFKEKWFDGSKLGKTSSPENDLEELTDAFNSIHAGSGYVYGQENSAWGIHYAIKKLRENGRYLSYSGEIVENSAKGYMPSEKMIIFLTDENMDGENLPSGYDEDDVLEKLYSKLNSTYNGMPDNIDLNGIFHIKKDGNTAGEVVNSGINYYERVKIKPYTRYNGSIPEYRYTSGTLEEWIVYSKKEWINQGWMWKEYWDDNNYDYDTGYRKDRVEWKWSWDYWKNKEIVYYSQIEWTNQGEITREEWNEKYAGNLDYKITSTRNEEEWIEYDDNETPILGIDPADDGDISHTDFKYYNTANNFFMYEMGETGEGVKSALDRAINNLGIIQRWELSYLTPFNEYDGTTRTVDFELIDLEGKDGIKITRDIKNLNEEKDKQYTVKEEKLALEFENPSVDNLELSIIDGVGTITFLGKARYNEYDEENNPIVVEDMINEYKLDVLDSNNKLLFSRNTDSIERSLSDEGWLDSKVTKDGVSKILAGREKSWVHVINNSGKDILSYIDKARYILEGENIYKIEFMNSEVEKIKVLSAGNLKLNISGSDINIDEEEFKELMKDRSDTWYELKNTSGTPDLLDEFLTNNDFEKIKDDEYRIKLRDFGLVKLLDEKDQSDEGIELKISNTKLEELSNKESLGDTFGEQGWYQFKVVLTEDEIQTLINSEIVKSTEKINLEARIVTDLFSKTGVLKDVKVDLSTPKIKNVSLENKTLFNFLNTMYSLNKKETFSPNQVEKYSKYDAEIEANYVITNDGSYAKDGDVIDLELIVEGKNIYQNDIVKGIAIDGWSNPKIIEITSDLNDEVKKFKIVWKNEVIYSSGTSNAVVKNDIKNQFGLTSSQDITVLKFDSRIKISPKVTGREMIDDIYYLNSNYNIDLGTADTGLRAGVATLDYDKTQADTTRDGDYYGKYENYYEIKEPLFGGGVKSGSIPVVIDSGESHSTDGEYKIQVYGMSRSGLLNGVTDYSSGNFKTIMENNSNGKNIIIRVDTVDPKITNISVEESSETSDENYYYFDLSFEIEDFNTSYKKLEDNIKGGHLLKLKNGNTEILDQPVYDGNKTITYKIKVKKPKVSNGLITEVTIIAEDKAGNRKEEKVEIRVPKDIQLKVYEEVQGWGNGKKTKIKDSGREYTFTKGGAISLINDPVIYAVVPKSIGPDDDTEITKLKIEKLNENPVAEKILVLSGGSEDIEIRFNFSRERKNIVRVTPISKAGIEGKSKELNFIVDTRINTSYLDNEIIGSLNGKNVEIDLSKIEELSGVEGYEYIFTVEGKKSKKVIERGLNGKSFVTSKGESIDGIEKINTSEFIGGSNGKLVFTVYDNLGHKKTFEKTYFIPKESDGIIAKISGESKQRESKLKIVTNGIELESSINRSSEYEKEDEIKESEDPLNKS